MAAAQLPDQVQYTRWTIDLASPLNALTASPDGARLLVGGRSVLKVLRLSPLPDHEEEEEARRGQYNRNVRDETVFTIEQNLRVGRKGLSYAVNDVKWHWSPSYSNYVASGATNGSVVLFNLDNNKAGHKREVIFSEHQRAVNRVCWKPNDAPCFLSASQDGTMRLWDIRDKQSATLITPMNDSCRDVQFSDSNILAAVFENGVMQLWDVRRPNACLVQTVSAHNGLVLGVDWHPDDRALLATAGGRDRCVKIWDTGQMKLHKPPSNQSLSGPPSYSGSGHVASMSAYNSSVRPHCYVQTIAAVSRVSWRPQHRYEVASAANIVDFGVHVWDIQKPYVPRFTFKGHRNVVTGILWYQSSADVLLTCSKDGQVIWHPLSHASQPCNELRCTSMAFNCFGEIAVVNEPINRSSSPPRMKSILTSVNSSASTGSSGSGQPPLRTRGATLLGNEGVSLRKIASGLSSLHSSTGSFIPSPREGPNRSLSYSRLSALSLDTVDTDASLIPGVSRPMSMANTAATASTDRSVTPKETHRPVHIFSFEDARLLDFDSSAFVAYAKKYWFLEADGSIVERCRHNASVAADAGHGRTCQVWSNLAVMAADAPAISQLFPVDWAVPAADFEQSPDDVQQALAVFDAKSLSSSAFTYGVPSLGANTQSSLLSETLAYYRNRSDVQMCTYLILIFGTAAFDIPEHIGTEILANYVELLNRHQLFQIAACILKFSPYKKLARWTQQSTSMVIACAKCGKSVCRGDAEAESSRPGPSEKYMFCSKHHVMNMCAVCHQPVSGLYIWCSGCGQGGHAKHIQWLRRQTSSAAAATGTSTSNTGQCPFCSHGRRFDADEALVSGAGLQVRHAPASPSPGGASARSPGTLTNVSALLAESSASRRHHSGYGARVSDM